MLDPFAGVGTVGRVAAAMGRRFILIEKRADYYTTLRRELSQPALATQWQWILTTCNTIGARTMTTTPNLYDLNSAAGVRQIVAALFQGYNYRLYTEGQTRNQLLDAYRQLAAVRRRLPANAGHSEWMAAVHDELGRSGTTWPVAAWPDQQDRPESGHTPG